MAGLTTPLDENVLAPARVASVPWNTAQHVRPIGRIFTFTGLEILHETRIVFTEPVENRLESFLQVSGLRSQFLRRKRRARFIVERSNEHAPKRLLLRFKEEPAN